MSKYTISNLRGALDSVLKSQLRGGCTEDSNGDNRPWSVQKTATSIYMVCALRCKTQASTSRLQSQSRTPGVKYAGSQIMCSFRHTNKLLRFVTNRKRPRWCIRLLLFRTERIISLQLIILHYRRTSLTTSNRPSIATTTTQITTSCPSRLLEMIGDQSSINTLMFCSFLHSSLAVLAYLARGCEPCIQSLVQEG